MRQDLISINAILDASGSMAGLIHDTVGGFNIFLQNQQEFPGEALFTLCTFNNVSKIVYDCKPIKDVSGLTVTNYTPGGGTALFDAVGTTINSVEAKIKAMPEEERPSKVIFLIITDGEENASKEYSLQQIKNKIEELKNNSQWEFVFMGANIDAFTAGTSLGISSVNSVSYNADVRGTAHLYDSLSQNLNSYRASKSAKLSDQDGFFSIAPPVIKKNELTSDKIEINSIITTDTKSK